MRRIIGLIVVLTFLSCNTAEIQIVAGKAQGTTYSVVYISEKPAKQIKPLVEACLERIDASMSTYRYDSLITKINNGENLPLDDDFIAVFKASKLVYQQSEGYFDPSIGKLISAWGFGRKEQHKALAQSEIDSLLRISGFSKIHLKGNRLEKDVTGIELNFNAIAQGYTADVIAHELEKQGIENYIVEVGGELFIRGSNIVENRPWTIGVDNPLLPPNKREVIATLSFENKGLATSGNYRKVWTDSLTGRKIVHTLNPKTGLPQSSNLLSTTVVAPSAMLADAYATTFMVRGIEWTKSFVQAHSELAVMLLYTTEEMPNEIQKYTSENFEKMLHSFVQ